MAKIRMMNMMFYGFQGVYEYEKEQGAKLNVDVEMVTRDDKACDTDRIFRLSVRRRCTISAAGTKLCPRRLRLRAKRAVSRSSSRQMRRIPLG